MALAQYAAECPWCREAIAAGTSIQYRGGYGWCHATCPDTRSTDAAERARIDTRQRATVTPAPTRYPIDATWQDGPPTLTLTACTVVLETARADVPPATMQPLDYEYAKGGKRISLGGRVLVYADGRTPRLGDGVSLQTGRLVVAGDGRVGVVPSRVGGGASLRVEGVPAHLAYQWAREYPGWVVLPCQDPARD